MIPRRSRSATSSLRAISVVVAPSIADPSPPRRPIRRNRICGFTGKDSCFVIMLCVQIFGYIYRDA